MSSFDYTDNFNGFNDLINRADFLTEMADSAKKAISQLAKTKDGKVGLNDLVKMYQHKTKGTSPAASYAKNMLWLVAMAEQDFITDEQKEFIKRTTNMGSSTAFAKAVKDAAPDAYDALYGEEQKSEDLIKFVGENSIVLLRRAIMNMPGDNFIYVGPDVEDKELDAAVSSQKVEDDIEDVADELEQSTADTFETFKAAKEDPTTMVEIRIEDPSKVEVVKDMVKKYANEHLDVEGDSVTFSADPGSPFVKAIEKYGEETIRRAFIGDLTRGSGSRVGVAIMAPGAGFDEDYEQIDDREGEGPSMANYPGGAPGSYAMGEEGGGITEVEDEEVVQERLGDRLRKRRQRKSDGAKRGFTDRNISRRGGSGRPGTALRKAGGGRPRYFRTGSKNRKSEAPGSEKGVEAVRGAPPAVRGAPPQRPTTPWTKKTLPPGGKPLAKDPKPIKGSPINFDDLPDDPPYRHRGRVIGEIGVGPDPIPRGIGSIPSPKKPAAKPKKPQTAWSGLGPNPNKPKAKNPPMVLQGPTGKGSSPPKYIHRGDEAMAGPGYKPKAKAPAGHIGGLKAIKSGGNYSPGFSDEEDPHIKNLYMGGGKVEEHPDYPEHEAREELEKDERKKKKKKRGRENEEEFNYSPMLDSHQTNTSGYLTEQVASDKRNKKSEVKKQSFKEKYKPKTHWQLEELRRYGL